MKKALVTGADGFIGSHLTELLLERGYFVRALSQYNSFNNWGWLEDVSKGVNLEIVSGDVRDSYFCKEIVKGVDIIFHLAALIAIPYSYVAPASYIETNISGTMNICQAAKELGNIRVIHTSTSEVYGSAQYVPIDEKHPKQPQSPYSASKIGADAIAMSFYYSFNLPVTIARPFNTYGPRQSSRAVIPTIITQIASGQRSIKLGDPTPTRDFNFVKDTCKGFIALAESENSVGQEINIASNSEYTIAEIANRISIIMNAKIDLETDSQRFRPAKSEVSRLFGDNKKIIELTGWAPEYSIDEGLKLTIEWFSGINNLAKYKTDIYNV